MCMRPVIRHASNVTMVMPIRYFVLLSVNSKHTIVTPQLHNIAQKKMRPSEVILIMTCVFAFVRFIKGTTAHLESYRRSTEAWLDAHACIAESREFPLLCASLVAEHENAHSTYVGERETHRWMFLRCSHLLCFYVCAAILYDCFVYNRRDQTPRTALLFLISFSYMVTLLVYGLSRLVLFCF